MSKLPEHVARNRVGLRHRLRFGLARPAFGMCRVEWPDTASVEFHLSHGDWIRLLRRSGLEVEDLIEPRPAVGATSRFDFVTLEWARQWPCEEVWKARKAR